MTLTDRELKHLKTVIDYLYNDESKDYETEGRSKDHIFVSVLGLQEILWRGSPTPQPLETNDEIAEMRRLYPEFDADERRREKLAKIMADDPTMTTKEAIHILNG